LCCLLLHCFDLNLVFWRVSAVSMPCSTMSNPCLWGSARPFAGSLWPRVPTPHRTGCCCARSCI
jgi:hypothetical protein